MINFCEPDGEVIAKIYRHCDGYPEGVLPDLKQFFKDVEEQCAGDTRFDDPEYLAAKFVVWQANQNVQPSPFEGKDAKPEKMLNFLSLGIAKRDHGDVEYLYDVICLNARNKRPEVKHREV
jgi:hypothetical protein